IPAVAPAPDSSSRCRSPDTGLTFPVTWRTVPDSSEARYRTALDRSPRRRLKPARFPVFQAQQAIVHEIVPEAYGKSQLVTAHKSNRPAGRGRVRNRPPGDTPDDTGRAGCGKPRRPTGLRTYLPGSVPLTGVCGPSFASTSGQIPPPPP